MQYFNPERPRIGDMLCYTSHPHSLPGFYLTLNGPNTVEVAVWLASDDNAFSCKSIIIDIANLSQLIEKYQEDPEATLKELFSWTPRSRQTTPRLTLEDLGL